MFFNLLHELSNLFTMAIKISSIPHMFFILTIPLDGTTLSLQHFFSMLQTFATIFKFSNKRKNFLCHILRSFLYNRNFGKLSYYIKKEHGNHALIYMCGYMS